MRRTERRGREAAEMEKQRGTTTEKAAPWRLRDKNHGTQ